VSEHVKVSVEPNGSAADIEVVESGLRAFNVAAIGDAGQEPVNVFLRDESGQIVGGLIGQIKWRWVYVAILWVSEVHRGKGHGAALLAAAEEFGRSRGCVGVHLDTFGYQARPFYEAQGYQLFGTLDGYPPGSRHFHLAKRLAEG